MFAIADAAFKTFGMQYKCLERETTPCERLTGEKPFNYHDRLQIWGSDRFVHQHPRLRGAGAKSHSYAKRGVHVGYDRSSPVWYVWLTEEEKLLVKSEHVTFRRVERLNCLVR